MIFGKGPAPRSSAGKPALQRRNITNHSGRNIRIKIEYSGTDFCGWQVQHEKEKRPSVQESIEKSLHKILQEKVKLTGSGRTDAGVHAFEQSANFVTKSAIPLDKLQKGLNSLLPEKIVVTGIEEVVFNFHSRFDAKSKVYRYIILNRSYPSSLLRNRVYFCLFPLNLKLMRSELQVLLGRHDFKAFSASGSRVKNTIRIINNISIKEFTCRLFPLDCKLIIIDLEANGFLYNMVRNIVGTIIEIGRGRFSRGSLKKILLSKDRKLAGPTAPARGLYLVKVKY